MLDTYQDDNRQLITYDAYYFLILIKDFSQVNETFEINSIEILKKVGN